MKQLFELEELIGKTIKQFKKIRQDKIIIIFEQSEFTILKSDIDDEDSYVSISSDFFDTRFSLTNYKLLHELGLIDDNRFNEFESYRKHGGDLSFDDFREKRAEEIHKLQQLAQKYPEIATLK